MKKAAIVLLIIILAIGGSLFYLWRQATRLPEWYAGRDAASDGTVITYGKGMEDIRRSLERTVEDQLQKSSPSSRQVKVVLDADDANKLFAAIISKNTETYQYLNAIKASRTVIKDGSLDFGVVVDASEMFKDALRQDDKGAGAEAIPLSGLLKGRELSLGLKGKYGVKDGRLQLDKEGRIRIGALSFSLKKITNRLGISDDQLKKTLKKIELGKFKMDNLEAVQNKLLLKGSYPYP